MITDNQVRKLMMYLQQEQLMGVTASKSGMDEKTARLRSNWRGLCQFCVFTYLQNMPRKGRDKGFVRLSSSSTV